jgi:voltage-gated potassium channel
MWLKVPERLKELRFLQLTLYTVGFVIVSPLLSSNLIINILAEIFLLNSLLVSLSASEGRFHLEWPLWGLWGTGVICYLLVGLGVAPSLTPLLRLLYVILNSLLLLGCIGATLAFIFRSERITLDIIFAAVVVYLFMAFTYAQFYHLFYFWQPDSFLITSQSGPPQIFEKEMVYFSLVTIATLGYGDIVPLMPMARMVAAVEAVMGQFYVAILVAWLVGMFISQSMAGTHKPKDAPTRPADGVCEPDQQEIKVPPTINARIEK